jgi:hypothetical protein
LRFFFAALRLCVNIPREKVMFPQKTPRRKDVQSQTKTLSMEGSHEHLKLTAWNSTLSGQSMNEICKFYQYPPATAAA